MGCQPGYQSSVLKLHLSPDSCENPRILEMSSEVSHKLILGNSATLARPLTSSSVSGTNVYRQPPACFLCASGMGLWLLLHPACLEYGLHPQALKLKSHCWPGLLLSSTMSSRHRSRCRLDFPVTFLEESPTQHPAPSSKEPQNRTFRK